MPLPANSQASVVLTRPKGKNEALASRLQAAGFSTLLLPALCIGPLATGPVLPKPADYDLIVFVSGNAVHYYLELLATHGLDGAWPATTRAATVGASSATLLYESGLLPEANILHPDASLASQDSESLWPILQQHLPTTRKVLIVRGHSGREWLGRRLLEAGLQVDRLAVYEREPAQWKAQEGERLEGVLRDEARPCVFLLTSGEGVDAVHSNLSRLGLAPLWTRARFIAIHERVASRLQSLLPATGKVDAPMVKICQPNDDAIFDAVVQIALS
ncbi:MAG: uroporphyrinogen-III synthase [Candidimonas sp.]|nr:uroporphyrinogen-III synthase [Candidimonas sp.]NYT45876.1 uroporphyrinogen-III synthase [Alcaligenaceae bacterium]